MNIRDKIIELSIEHLGYVSAKHRTEFIDAILAHEVGGKGKCHGDYGCRRDSVQGVHHICPYSNCSDCDRYKTATIGDLTGKKQ